MYIYNWYYSDGHGHIRDTRWVVGGPNPSTKKQSV